MLSLTAIGLFVVVIVVVLCTALVLAQRGERSIAAVLVVMGFFAALVKIWLFQQFPQWQDINPDSITYHLNAQGFALHWQGEPVDAYEYELRGLKVWHEANLHGRLWEANDRLDYASVMGSHEWLYSAYVGIWYRLCGTVEGWTIYSNAAFAAFFPAAAFGLAAILGASRRLAFCAAGLAMLDPSAGVNASWLLKDTLVGFLAMGSLWAAVRFITDRGATLILPILIILFALLGVGRYVAFLALFLSIVTVMFLLIKGGERKRAGALGTALISAWGIFGLLYCAPYMVSIPPAAGTPSRTAVEALQRVGAPLYAVSAGVATLKAERGGRGADDTVLQWKARLRANPALAVTKSISHTLFAPYPWVALYPGLTWRSFSELYYPGVLVWVMCLPGIVWALWRGMHAKDGSFWLVAVFLAALLAAYTLFQGEWSTRQRVFALPAFFALAPIGWAGIYQRWQLRGRAVLRAEGT